MRTKFVLFSVVLALIFQNPSFSYEKNTLRTKFLNNQAVICGINIRNFNAQDTNKNGMIDLDEISGNFINAIERLDEIKSMGINTLHILPITSVGKLKALGTAGSLYSMSSFNEVNEQLIDRTSDLSPKEQVKKFVEECHKRDIHVIIDLPSCGSYDLFLKHPELFIKDDKQCSIVPSDWTDVRLLNTGVNGDLNQDLIKKHKEFIDFITDIGADGLRADVATIKPSDFWVKIIEYARQKDSEFLFLAEASDSWREPPSKYAEFTPYDELLKIGFDGYYGSFFNLKEWNAEQLFEHIKFNQKLLSSYPDKKSVIMSFTTHDEVSPILLHGENFSIMIDWLEATLPFNGYSIDGFADGDDYIYPLANTKADFTDTDDDYYFVHRGKLDIFNFSRKPGGGNQKLLENFKNAAKFKTDNINLITKGNFLTFKTNDEKIFAFSRILDDEKIIVLGNLDFNNDKNFVTIKTPILKKGNNFDIIKGDNIKIKNKRLETNLNAGEIKVIKLK